MVIMKEKIHLVMRDTKQRYYIGFYHINLGKVEIFDSDFKKIKYFKIRRVFCGLVNEGYLYFGGENRIFIFKEDDLSEARTIETHWKTAKIVPCHGWVVAVGEGGFYLISKSLKHYKQPFKTGI